MLRTDDTSDNLLTITINKARADVARRDVRGQRRGVAQVA